MRARTQQERIKSVAGVQPHWQRLYDESGAEYAGNAPL